MSKKGDCYDNAVTESWNHSLKVEAIHGDLFKTCNAALRPASAINRMSAYVALQEAEFAAESRLHRNPSSTRSGRRIFRRRDTDHFGRQFVNHCVNRQY
jgi:hypothetical protein